MFTGIKICYEWSATTLEMAGSHCLENLSLIFFDATIIYWQVAGNERHFEATRVLLKVFKALY